MSENKRLKVALLWHMHQPFYFNPKTKKFQMPWVRLHGLKDYLDMPLAASRYEGVKVTFNLVPSLLDQIDMYCKGATDRHQELTLIPARELNHDQKKEILDSFFSAHFPRMIDPYLRYRQLYRKKESCNTDIDLAAKIFSSSEWRDLQVWSNLAWIDPFFRIEEPVKSLLEKGRDFTEEDKILLLDYQIDLLGRIIPEYKRLYQNGQIDISYTPYYHPILPLLINSESAREVIPDVELPRQHFAFPEDARWHVRECIDDFHKRFDGNLNGIWPSEGSISEAALTLLSEHGIKWAASDQEVLHYSLIKSGKNPKDYSPHTAYFYEGAPSTRLFFRDQGLSDRIGFVYSTWDYNRAVDDFIQNLKDIGKFLQNRLDNTVIPIILDGENAWEYFRNDGTEFLRHLYQSLSEDKDIEMITFSDAAERIKPDILPRIQAGSWINHNFNIWIGHQEDNAAWDLLYQARQAVIDYETRHTDADPSLMEKAWRQIYIAEGSDWCWWYGDDHIGEHNQEFDKLFREHLRNVYEILGLDIPPELDKPLYRGKMDSVLVYPESLVTPKIDGRLTQYYEWSGAGMYDCTRADKAMHRTDRILSSLYFAYDYDRFYIRLDFEKKFDLVAENKIRVAIDFRNVFRREIYPATKPNDEQGDFEYAFDNILEIACRRRALMPEGSGRVEFFVGIYKAGTLAERWPADSWIAIDIPEREKEIFWQV